MNMNIAPSKLGQSQPQHETGNRTREGILQGLKSKGTFFILCTLAPPLRLASPAMTLSHLGNGTLNRGAVGNNGQSLYEYAVLWGYYCKYSWHSIMSSNQINNEVYSSSLRGNRLLALALPVILVGVGSMSIKLFFNLWVYTGANTNTNSCSTMYIQ